jgi:protein-S-isoprenylcysteine O-methyltransferase Ste14
VTQPLVFHNAVAAILFFSSIVAIIALESALIPNLRTRRREDWSLFFVLGTMVASAVGASLAAWFRVAPLSIGSWWPVIAGLLLMWSGFAFRAWAIVTLGRFFQVTVAIDDGHRVIDSGPYRWLRHPAYLGAIVNLTGFGVAEGDWASIALMMAGATVALLVRIHVEERALLASLGEDYARFSRNKARLLPGVY